VDLTPTAEQEAIQASIRSFLESELPMSRVRAIAEGAPQELEAPWRRAGELGFFGLAVPSQHGGTGYSVIEEMLLFEELGRALAPGPWLGTVLAAHALAEAKGDREAARRADVQAGRSRVALIDVEEGASGSEAKDDRFTLRDLVVADAARAELLLVLHGDAVRLVETSAAGVGISSGQVFDATRPVARVSLEAVPAERLPASAHALRRIGTALSCAEAVGASARLVELSVAYASVREQFGRPIGSFQAVKHRCADMSVRAEAARAATIYATLSLRDESDDRDFQLSVAKVLAADAFVQNAADNVQNHGGMGYTWECDAHFFVKRARSFEAILGSSRRHLDAIAARLRGA